MNITENTLAKLTDSELYKQQEIYEEEEREEMSKLEYRPAYPLDPTVWLQRVGYDEQRLSEVRAASREIEDELDRRENERWDKLCAEVASELGLKQK